MTCDLALLMLMRSSTTTNADSIGSIFSMIVMSYWRRPVALLTVLCVILLDCMDSVGIYRIEMVLIVDVAVAAETDTIVKYL